MGIKEPAPLYSITHQTHMEDIQGSGFMTTNGMAFGPDLLGNAKLSASHLPNIGMAFHPWASRSQHHSAACSITHQTHKEDIQGSGGS
jgi:hypothetical protein